MTEQLLATLTTDEHGECTYTYTGEGNGVIQFLAKHGIIQSEIYEVLDCIYYITNSFDLYKTSAVTVTPNTDSVTFSASGGNGFVYLIPSDSSILYYEGNYAFEFKLINHGTGIGIRCGNTSSSSRQFSIDNYSIEDEDIIRLANDGSKVRLWINGTEQTSTTSNNGTIRYGFNIPDGESITVTDMKFYPV